MDVSMTVEKLKLFIFDSFWRDTNKRLRQFIARNDIILDIGSHRAPYTKYLSNTVVGIDLQRSARFGFSKDAVRELERKTNFIPIIASAENLPFKAGFFDKIVCTEVLEHVHNDESAVSEMARVLDSGGRIFLTTPNGDVIPLECGIKEHVRHYHEKDLHNLLIGSFEQVIIIKRFWFFHFLNLQYKLMDLWIKNKRRVHLLLAIFLASWMYDAVYLSEKIMHMGRYNLVAFCSKPIDKRN
jgi:SAM-dependent methyltransferase